MSFRREAYVPKGGPLTVETVFRRRCHCCRCAAVPITTAKHHFKAERHSPVRVKLVVMALTDRIAAQGASGKPLCELDPETQEPLYEIADLIPVSRQLLLLVAGGRGNIHFVTSVRRAPAFAEKGEPAQEHWIELEMNEAAHEKRNLRLTA